MPEHQKQSPSSAASLLQRILRAPLLHFLIFGLLIFAFAQWRTQSIESAEHTIHIDAGLEQYLKNLYRAQFAYYPDEPTLEALIQAHIHDEVLFREALNLGLDQDDQIIRRRMVQKLEFLLLDSGAQTTPSDNTLRTWYEAHPKDYESSTKVSFRHIYLSTDGNRTEQALQRALTLLELAAEEDISAEAGDRFPLRNFYNQQTATAVQQQFGQNEFSSAVFTLPVGVWSGPVQSGYGLHLIKVEERSPAALRPFEDAREDVLKDWLEQDKQARFEQQLAKLKSQYKVLRSQ